MKSDLDSWEVCSLDELTELKAFLKENKLPFDDITLEGNRFFLYRNQLGRIIGSGGLEFHGNFSLLRSVAVASEFRNRGYGEAITEDLITRAREKHVWSVHLLTETAQPFFEKLGFRNEARDKAPLEIRSSSEFSSVCPVSAVLMSFDIFRPSTPAT